MAKIFDFFSKKPVEEAALDYKTRKQTCIATTVKQGRCYCTYCQQNEQLADKLAQISKWLITDHTQKTKSRIYYGDWMEIMYLASLKVQAYIKSLDKEEEPKK